MILDSPLAATKSIIGDPTIQTILLGVIAYFFRDFAGTVRRLDSTLRELSLHVAENYVTKEEMRGAIETHENHLHD